MLRFVNFFLVSQKLDDRVLTTLLGNTCQSQFEQIFFHHSQKGMKATCMLAFRRARKHFKNVWGRFLAKARWSRVRRHEFRIWHRANTRFALNLLVPLGYQDETGFHFGRPIIKSVWLTFQSIA
jgi:hypothetical protein